MIDCSIIQQAVTSISLVQHCAHIGSGALRLLTPFQYPNGSNIDLFLEEPEPLFKTLILSDLGQTTAYLLDLQVKPWATNKRRQIVEDVCRSLGVSAQGGRLLVEISEADVADLTAAIMRLAQACVRISDLAYSARILAAGSFREEIEEFFSTLELQYEQDAVVPIANGREVKFDFRVFGATRVSLVQSLSAASVSSAHNVAVEAFTRLYDVGAKRRKQESQFITIIDETSDVFKEHDISRLESSGSSVFWFPADQEPLTVELVS